MADKALSLRVVVRDMARAKAEVESLRAALDKARLASKAGATGTFDQANATRAHVAALKTVIEAQKKQTEAIGRHKEAVGRLAGEFKGVRTAVMGVAGAAIAMGAAFGAAATLVKRFEERQNFLRALRFNVGDKAGEVDKGLRSEADRLGFRQQDAQPGLLKLAASGQVATQDLIPTITAFTALAKSSGADAVQMGRAFEQFTQIASQGQLQGDELRAIQENGVQLRKLLADAGIKTGDQKNPVSFKQIQDTLLAFGASAKAQKFLAEASEQSTSSFARLWNVVDLDLIPAIGGALQPALIDATNEILEWVRSIDPEKVRKWTEALVASARGMKEWVSKNWEAVKAFIEVTATLWGLHKVFKIVRAFIDVWLTKSLVSLATQAANAALALERIAAQGLLPGGAKAAGGAASGAAGGAASAASGAAGGAAASKMGFFARVGAWFKNVGVKALGAARSAWGAIAGPATWIALAMSALYLSVIKLIETLSGIDSRDESSFFNGEQWYFRANPGEKARVDSAGRPATQEEILGRKRELSGADVNRMQNRLNYEGVR